jgi:glycerophosphoryl diester phosphodiesterase
MTYQLIAHRGYSAVAPENTLASFRAALEKPILGVEFDVHLTADGVPVIIHDGTVDRTTNDEGKVEEKTIAQLRTLDAGSWFHPQFAEEKIPTLEEVLALFSETAVHLYIEAKSPQNWSEQGIQNLIQLIDSWRDRCTLASFNHHFITEIKRNSPQLKIGYGLSNANQYSFNYLETLEGEKIVLFPHFSLILEQPELTRKLLDRDLEIITWTVDDINIAKKLADLNILKIITNNLLVISH